MYFVSIKKKLLNNTLLLLVGAFCLVLALIIGLNLYQSQQNLKFSQNNLQHHLEEKGQMLIHSNQYALASMVEDNEISSIREFIESTVSRDPEVIYGFFMDFNGKIWAISDKDSLYGQLSDEHKSQLKLLSQTKVTEIKTRLGHEIQEFATPVFVDNEKMGVVSFGYSKESLHRDIAELKKRASKSALISIFIILFIVFGTLLLTYTITIKQAETITNPIASLAKSARTIANGNYNLQIKAESNDEIGELSRDFDSMRKTVKIYTERLKDMVQEKVAQINDILDNIDEGICTINLAGEIRGQHSHSLSELLGTDTIENQYLSQLLNLNDATKDHFDDWLSLVSKRALKMRWAKIVQLCPILEVQHLINQQEHSLKLNFQKIFNKKGEVERLMVQITDVTEAKILEQKIEEEKLQYEHQLKLVLGVTENPPEAIELFISDSTQKINEVLDIFNHVKTNETSWKSEYMNLWMENIHTIKGNAGSLGFDRLNASAHHCENILLSPEIISGINPTPDELKQALHTLIDLIEEIKQKDLLLHGKNNQHVLRVPKLTVKRLIQDIKTSKLTSDELLNRLNRLDWQTFELQSQKYKRIFEKVNLPNNLKIQFVLNDGEQLLPRKLFHKIDAALIHIFRNSISHAFRKDYNGSAPQVNFNITMEGEWISIKISDNGVGIHPDKILQQAKELNLVEKNQELTEKEIIDLIFHPSFTSTTKATLISGRGVGMSMVKRVVNDLHGSINVLSEPNKGTEFHIQLNQNEFDI